MRSSWRLGLGCLVAVTFAEMACGDSATAEREADGVIAEMVQAGGQVTLCHRPPGQPSDAHTIVVGAAAVKAHLAHGDSLGACGSGGGGGATVSSASSGAGGACGQAVWIDTGSLSAPRDLYAAVRLPDGRVLAAGGRSGPATNFGPFLASAEIFDPVSHTWTPTSSMAQPRVGHAAIVLASGKVLVVGGNVGGHDTSAAELYDPATGGWSATGSMAQARATTALVRLQDGRALVCGGTDWQGGPDNFLSSCELYDPATGAWSATASLSTVRTGLGAIVLGNGDVLAIGGSNGSACLTSCELYHPATGSWSPTGSASAIGCANATLLSLPDGRVLAVGSGIPEVYDPATGSWAPTGNLVTSRSDGALAMLANGTALYAGGGDFLDAVEIYQPATNGWTAAPQMPIGRRYFTLVPLGTGDVLAAGGEIAEPPPAMTSHSERFAPCGG